MAEDNVTIDIQSKIPDTPVFTGVVQVSFPSWGWCVVVPSGTNNYDPPIICRLNLPGGLLGSTITSCPVAGSQVSYRKQPGTDKGYIISSNPQGSQPEAPRECNIFRQTPLIPPIGDLMWIQQVVTDVQTYINNNKEHSIYTGIPQDVYEGDTYIGDKFGPGILQGRAQLTIKGSQNSYIQMASLQDKVNVLTVAAQIDTPTDLISIRPSLNKLLKASGTLQGLGGRSWDNQKPLKISGGDPSTLQYTQKYPPGFRFQSFQGGAVKGTHNNLINFVKEAPAQVSPVIAGKVQSLTGDSLQLMQGSLRIKTAQTTGIVDSPFKAARGTQDQKKELQQREKDTQEMLKKFKEIKLSDNGLQRVLQVDSIIQDTYTRALISNMLGHEVAQLLQQEVEPFPLQYGNYLEWDEQEPSVQQDFVSDFPTAQDTDSFTGQISRRFRNTSIISQDPDGSITLKDGWGSQITLSHGNIYISSALDTFIRPGRDLINIVPQHFNVSTNGQMQVVAKKNVRIGAQKNLMLASAIGGQEGYTTLQNRSKQAGQNSGVVIRSNGNLSLTASQDMHIGINDKRTQNNKDRATYSDGSIFIQGGVVRVESRGQLRLLGTQTGLYACDTSSGTGIQLTLNAMNFIAPSIDMDTAVVRIGTFATTYTLKTGPTEQYTVHLNKGAGSVSVLVKGQVFATDMLSRNNLTVGNYLQAGDYIRLQTQQLETIPGVQRNALNRIRKQIDKPFTGKLTSFKLSFRKQLQKWYKDSFICKKEFTLFDSWKVTKIPTMCWQLTQKIQGSFRKLQKTSVTATGGQQQTCSYPGKQKWNNSQMMSSLEQGTYKINYNKTVQQAYLTYTEGE